MRYRLLASTTALITAGIAGNFAAAQAQTAPVAPAAVVVAPADGDGQGLQEIIVTASRREQTLQRTAIPLTVVTSDVLGEAGVDNVQDLTKLLTALKIGAAGAGSLQITSRGIGSFGGNTFNEPGVPINLDGVYLARTQGATAVFFDVSRVELLKGPQGTLYGRNSTGGVLNILTNDPTDTFGGTFTGEIGNYSNVRATGAVNIPIATGVSLRVAGQVVDRDGYLTDGYSDDKNSAIRAKLKLEPTDRLTILLETSFSWTKGRGYAAVFDPYADPNNPYLGPSSPASNAIISSTPGIGPFLAPIHNDGFLDNKVRTIQGTVNYDLGFAKATLIVFNDRNTQHYLQYTAGFPVQDDSRGIPNYYTTAELRLASTGDGPFKWVVGGFYYHDDLRSNISVNQGFTFADSRDLALHTESFSGFGEGTYAVTDHIRLTAGGRYTSDQKSESGVTLGPAAPCSAPSTPVVDPVLGPVCSTPNVGATTFKKFTYKVGAEADVGPRSLVYANFATGFKSGGFFASANYNPAGTFPSNAFRPEEISAWTLGSKNRFFDNTVQVNAEAFYWKYKDKQVSYLGFVPPNNLILVTANAARATLYGVETEALWAPTKHDDFSATLAYLHTRYGTYQFDAVVPGYAQPAPPGAPLPGPVTGCASSPTVGIGGAPRGVGVPGISTVDCSGKPISLAPKWVATLAYRHSFDLPAGSKLTPGVRTNIESGYWVSEEYYPGEYQTPFTTTDIDLTFATAKNAFELTAYVQNVEDTAVGQSGFLQPTVGRALINLRPPRTYGLRATVNF